MTHDPKLVEAMARAMMKWPDAVLCEWPTPDGGRYKKLAWQGQAKDRATRALDALCAHLRLTPEALRALARGEAVVVLNSDALAFADRTQRDHARRMIDLERGGARTITAAANPYAREADHG